MQQGRAADRTRQPAAGGQPDPAVVFQRADVLVELHRPEEAVTLLHAALAGHPGRADLWGQLAMALLAAGRTSEAYAAAQRRLELAPQNEWGYRLASLSLTGLGRRQEASQAARTSVGLAPHEWRAYARLARALADEGRLREAWDAGVRAVELAPEEPEAHMAIGAVAMALRGWQMAEQAYRHVLALEPTNAAARNNLALVTLHRGEVTGAASGFADAVATDPRVDVARRNLEVAVRVAIARLLRWQLLATIVGYLGLASAGPAPAAAAVTAGALVGLAMVTRLRWRALPATVRDFARSLTRSRKRFGLTVLAALAGYGALAGAVVLSMLGRVDSAVPAAAAAAVCTALAGGLAGRL
jgi:tetratricopeptide (TPR) repeat protein